MRSNQTTQPKDRRRKSTFVVARLIAVMAATARAQETSVEQRLDELEHEIRILKRQKELDQKAAQQKAKETPIATAGKEGFSLKSADGNFQLRLRAHVQADARFFLD